MIITTCPSCSDSFSLPDDLPKEAQLRCPLCHVEFELSAILDQLPPAIEVLNVPQQDRAWADAPTSMEASPSIPDNDSPGVGAGNDAGNSDLSLDFEEIEEDISFQPKDPSLPASPPAPFAIDASDSAAGGSQGFAASTMARPQKRKKNSGGVMMVVKVFLGGVVGLAIALFAIMWIPVFPNHDPFGVAHLFPSWMVPAELREDAEDSAKNTTDDGEEDATLLVDNQPASNSNPAPPQQEAGISPGTPIRSIDSEEPPPWNLPKEDEEDRVLAEEPQNPDETEASEGESPFEALADLTDPTINFEPKPADPRPIELEQLEGEQLELDQQIAEEVEQPHIHLGPRIISSPTEIDEAIDAAYDAKQAWNESADLEVAEKRVRAKQFYDALCEMAKKIRFADPKDISTESFHRRIDSLLIEIGNNHIDFIVAATFCGRQLGLTDRDSHGILVAGIVTAIEQEGDYMNTQVEVAARGDGKPICSVVSHSANVNLHDEAIPGSESGESPYEIGSKVMICGSLIDYPQSELLGYTGNDSLVVLSSVSVEIESP